MDTIFRYRTLAGKCDLGCGLGWEEIEQLVVIESQFTLDQGPSGRRFKREAIRAPAVVRGDRINDRVQVVEIGPGGLIAARAPFIARGEHVEVVLDVGERSYRFSAVGVWLDDDGDDYRVGMAFVGVPICLNVAAEAA